MSFFGDAAQTGTEFETGGGDMEPIPARTRLNAMPDDAKWDEYEGERYINIRWTVLAPESYKNRKIFQKIKVLNDDFKKADKAKRMLAAIDANAGGKLVQLDREPTDEDLQKNLLNKPMMIQVMVWETDDKSKSGNWVNMVSSGKKLSTPQQDEDDGDDIPF